MNGSTNRAILKLNSNELHFVRHNIGKSETLSEFPEFDKSNSPLPLIKRNFPFALQSRVNPHFHSHPSEKGNPEKMGNLVRTKLPKVARDDIHNEVLPLTLQSEIKQHQIISLIKGNC